MLSTYLHQNLRFRLLTEYHSFLFINSLIDYEITEDEVSVSLRSIIHSYKVFQLIKTFNARRLGFRLLTEYHSFLLKPLLMLV